MSEGTSGNDTGNPGGSIRPTLTAARGLIGRRTTAPITPGRLPSIRSRDLTLGGVKKKTFAPNIISRKIKEEPKEEINLKKEKKERDRDRQRDGPGRGRGRPEVIQSHSIFEQGPAEMMKKKGTWDKTVDMSDFGPSHIINIKKEKRETDEETKQILRMLEKDDFLDDPGLKNDIRNKPVQLPLAHSGWLFKEEDQEDVKPLSSSAREEDMEVDTSSVKVKEEPHDEEENPPGLRPAPAKAPPPFPQDVSVAELLQQLSLCKEDALLFLQLPDTLPGQPPTQDTKPIKTEVQSEDGQVMLIKQEKNQEAKEAENICTLGDLSEGQVGKLLIRKSGKVQLVLGRVTLDVTTGTPCSFLQELVSVGIGDSRSGEMIILGHVKHKLVCAPDFEFLLEQKHR
ncbi:DNA-directed RNA polymerase III subunit RPC4 [Zootoca vivipara]|uniref:DNA-directed RNA polymerase III subunit RPC4 n=1 Tax=Zootoca vivipara TaxID=8524 RepID=UPI001592752D|nr:DNA-directed RNA polymerase III subunit RPC4 [Zootoca vivipara]XP_034995334.1 DNA-directed RNA polymerase III subunit RPC4 [Zootoca vivipara]XP_034995335.1 DNA-directed RNA polymerase III subunit RPC4 [Zootoca vivipara]